MHLREGEKTKKSENNDEDCDNWTIGCPGVQAVKWVLSKSADNNNIYPCCCLLFIRMVIVDSSRRGKDDTHLSPSVHQVKRRIQERRQQH